MFSNSVLISSFGSDELTQSISDHTKIPICSITLGHFPDSETRIEVHTNLRNKHVVIVAQMRRGYVNSDFLSLTMLLDTCRRCSIDKITVILPYFPYSRSDKKDQPRVPIGAANIANILKIYQIDNIISLDLHSGQLQGLFDKGFHNLYMVSSFSRLICDQGWLTQNHVLVSPDAGSIKRLEAYENKLVILPYIVMHKTRDYSQPGTVTKSVIIGSQEHYLGKTAIIIDDILDTGGTMLKTIETLVSNGIKDVIIIATHGVLSENAIDKILSLDTVKTMIISNSLANPAKPSDTTYNKKILVYDCAPLLSQALTAIMTGGSVSKLFE